MNTIIKLPTYKQLENILHSQDELIDFIINKKTSNIFLDYKNKNNVINILDFLENKLNKDSIYSLFLNANNEFDESISNLLKKQNIQDLESIIIVYKFGDFLKNNFENNLCEIFSIKLNINLVENSFYIDFGLNMPNFKSNDFINMNGLPICFIENTILEFNKENYEMLLQNININISNMADELLSIDIIENLEGDNNEFN